MTTNVIRSASTGMPAALLGAMLALSACASDDHAVGRAALAPAELRNEITATAQVTSVDKAMRLVTLRREDGSLLQLVAGDEVRNFDQIEAGDVLRVRYQEVLRASLCPPGEDELGAQVGALAARAEPGTRPGAGAGLAVSVRVRIESIDKGRDIVVFSLSTGELVSRRIRTDEGRRFVKGLRIDDTVQLDYTQAVALTIEEV
jgi:hypothetical protein